MAEAAAHLGIDSDDASQLTISRFDQAWEKLGSKWRAAQVAEAFARRRRRR